MTGAEIKDVARPDAPERAAPEMLSFVPFFLENHAIRGRHPERLTVHLGLRDIPFRGQPGGDRVRRHQGGDMRRGSVGAVDGEDALRQRQTPDRADLLDVRRRRGTLLREDAVRLLVHVFPPCGGPLSFRQRGDGIGLGALLHQADERLGPVGRVEGDKAGLARHDPANQGLRAGVILFQRTFVAPEDDDVGLGQGRLAETLFRGVQADRLHRKARKPGKVLGDGIPEKTSVVGLPLLGLALIPDQDPDWGGLGPQAGEAGQQGEPRGKAKHAHI